MTITEDVWTSALTLNILTATILIIFVWICVPKDFTPLIPINLALMSVHKEHMGKMTLISVWRGVPLVPMLMKK